MGLIKSFLFGAAAVFATVAGLPSASDLETRGTGVCTSSEFAAPVRLGGTGTAFCESNWAGNFLPVTGLTAWGNQFVVGIQATYSDGSQSPIYGKTDGLTANTITVNYATDSFSKLVLYGNANGNFVRHIQVRTASGGVMNAGFPDPLDSGYVAFPQDVGSGLLYGFSGSTDGVEVNGLSFLFLASPVVEVDVSNFAFTNPPQGDTDITPTDIDEAHFFNSQPSTPFHWAFDNQKARSVTHAFTQTFVQTFSSMVGVSLMIGGGILTPGLMIGGSSSFTWTTTTMEATAMTVMTTKQVQYNADGNLNPGEGVDVIAVAGEGTGTFPYTSTVTFKLKNGHQYSFTEDGSLFLDDVSDAIVQVFTDNSP